MAHPKGNKDNLKWLEDLRDSMKRGPEVVPDEWRSTAQCAEDMGLSVSHTSRILRAGIKEGTVETRTFRVNAGTRIYPIPHFRFKA